MPISSRRQVSRQFWHSVTGFAFDAAAVDMGGEGSLYASAKRIFPQSVRDTYRRIKWVLLVLTLGIYYLLPFVRWDREPDAPSR
jgi:hypothetical protein